MKAELKKSDGWTNMDKNELFHNGSDYRVALHSEGYQNVKGLTLES